MSVSKTTKTTKAQRRRERTYWREVVESTYLYGGVPALIDLSGAVSLQCKSGAVQREVLKLIRDKVRYNSPARAIWASTDSGRYYTASRGPARWGGV